MSDFKDPPIDAEHEKQRVAYRAARAEIQALGYGLDLWVVTDPDNPHRGHIRVIDAQHYLSSHRTMAAAVQSARRIALRLALHELRAISAGRLSQAVH